METERFRKMINSRFLRSIKSKILFIFYLLVADYIMHLLFILLVPLPGKFTLHHFKKKLATKKKHEITLTGRVKKITVFYVY